MTDEDLEAVVRVWHSSGQRAYPFIDLWQRFTFDEARTVFRTVVASTCEVWVAATADGVVGYLAIRATYLGRLYVAPDHQRRGSAEPCSCMP